MLLFGAVGCAEGTQDATPQKEQTSQQTQSQAKFEILDNLSQYPFLAVKNTGKGKAENVQIVETESKKAMMPMAILKLMGDQLKPLPAPKALTLDPGDGEQVQLISQNVLKYTVQWTENGKSYESNVTMKEPGKIETH
jgi:hypothetical protein